MAKPNRFMFFESYYDAIEMLPEEERLGAYESITHYAFDGELPSDEAPLTIKALFASWRPNIDQSIKRISDGSEGGKSKGKNKNRDAETAPPVNADADKSPEEQERLRQERADYIRSHSPFEEDAI